MLRDRLTGLLCLGVATVAATWGGNDALEEASAQAARAARLASHADSVAPGAIDPQAAVPAADPSSTTVTAPAASTTTATAPGPTTTTAPGEAPAALVKRALLLQSDVPEGFTLTSPVPPDNAALPDSPLERCAGPDAAALTAAVGARARSATFTRPDTGAVSSTAVVFDQPASAEKVLSLMSTPPARSCFEGLLNARLARNPNLSQDVRGSIAPASSQPIGEGTVAYRFEVRLPAEDVDHNARPDDPPVRYVADFLMIRKGRTVVVAEFANLRQPWPEATLRGVATNLAAHI
ncbi:MAG TPA: hypothetical protein VFS16_11000 [Acidimicrobiia bacterium]|nr:hypothetical protein [Acidimicrobiia bacterium]